MDARWGKWEQEEATTDQRGLQRQKHSHSKERGRLRRVAGEKEIGQEKKMTQEKVQKGERRPRCDLGMSLTLGRKPLAGAPQRRRCGARR